MGEGSTILVAVYGALLGARHALEPDHLAAVSTMAAHGSSRTDVLRLGAAWGAGHATLVTIVGILLMIVEWTVPPWLAARAEPLAGLALIVLGIWTFWELRRVRVHLHSHAHGSLPSHTHVHVHRHESEDHAHPHPPGWVRSPWTAYVVGTIHGLAGSGAAAALAVLAAPSPVAATAYLLSFAAGTLLSMAAVSAFAVWPVMWIAFRTPRARQVVQGLAAMASLMVGLFLVAGL